MQLAETEIQRAILHSDPCARITALQCFSRSFSSDAFVMPLVIEAVETYGRENSVDLVAEGERLPQTESTIDWCLTELRRDFDEDDETLSDYRFALGGILAHSDRSLTLKSEPDILEARAFRFRELQFAFTNVSPYLGKMRRWYGANSKISASEKKDTPYLSEMDMPHANGLVETLGRGGATFEQRALSMLDEGLADRGTTLRGRSSRDLPFGSPGKCDYRQPSRP